MGVGVAVGCAVAVGKGVAVLVGVSVGMNDCTTEQAESSWAAISTNNVIAVNFSNKLVFLDFISEKVYPVSQLWQENGGLFLIFTFAVCVRSFAYFITIKEQHLGNALVGVDLRRQRGSV